MDQNSRRKSAGARRENRDAGRTPAPGYWDGEGVKGAPKIVVHLTEQRAFFYKGKTVVGESSISTGRKGFETPPGKYRVIQKDENHASNLYGSYVEEDGTVVQGNVEVGKDPKPEGTEFRGAPMPYFLRSRATECTGFVPRMVAAGCRARALQTSSRGGRNTPVVVKE